MFILTETLPWQVEINGVMYDIDLSFDNVLSVIDLLNDNEVNDAQQIVAGVYMLLGQDLDCTLQEQADIFVMLFDTFINNEQDNDVEYDLEGNPMPHMQEDDHEALYDIKHDAQYIYASFLQCYGMDLFEQQGKLHWWKFKALLSGLSEDTKFKKVLEIRQMELPTGKGTGKQREAIKKIKRAYALKER
ncbi:bacteriophage Gp15 family protein [Metasolibacillus sp.]|uniref:bacteriophage Gp15 family protein n=1 Tax=Metasolibacillus sp. TaxID=2703680 RepID=UPI0025E0171C|nr:bacteriophage Gp15 family protein [Metasolibacillus sp.]MCT6925316.1 bacteriophage Gp15 family protein [Metasolibacillus sp.]MCT6941454.1 bacteriophage Gp15 family protein [Metasolibacillus sp.]